MATKYERLSSIVDGLWALVEAPDMRWQPTDRPGFYMWRGPHGRVVIGGPAMESHGVISNYLRGLGHNGYSIEVSDGSGRIVDSAEITPITAPFEVSGEARELREGLMRLWEHVHVTETARAEAVTKGILRDLGR